MFELIVAYDLNNGIGYNGTMPWHFKKDLKHFSNITKSQYKNNVQNESRPTKPNVLIMGRKTFDSLPKLLEQRFHIVITTQSTYLNSINKNPESVIYIDSIPNIINILNNEYKNRMNIRNQYLDHNNKIFIIGGRTIYEYFLNNLVNKITAIYVTHIYQNYNCDTYFPNLNDYHEFKEDENYIHYFEEKNVVLNMKRFTNVYIM